jgi:outer membrane lipoprotein SlyB
LTTFKENFMRNSNRFASALTAVALVAGLAACANQPMDSTPVSNYPSSYPASAPNPYPAYPAGTAAPRSMVEYGRVTNVEVIRTNDPGKPGVAGAVIGGVAGAVLGHQVGRGTGKDLATIAGGVGGAVAGNAIQNNTNTNAQVRETYRISVQVDNGTYRSYDLGTSVDLRTGDRVRIENGQLYRM